MASAATITDLSSISPEDIKQRNTMFLTGEHEYDIGYDVPITELRRSIWNVRNGDLRTVLRNFPRDWPLVCQCAGWMHALAGKHFFPDANHRTAMATLRELLKQNDIRLNYFPRRAITHTTIRSHVIRRQIEPVSLDTLFRRDRLWLVWRLYFGSVIQSPRLKK